MNWERIKDKILIFGEDDYIFADMFTSIINEYEKVQNLEDLKFFTYSMLTELMDEKLIRISVFSHNPVILAIISLSKSLSPKYLRFSL